MLVHFVDLQSGPRPRGLLPTRTAGLNARLQNMLQALPRIGLDLIGELAGKDRCPISQLCLRAGEAMAVQTNDRLKRLLGANLVSLQHFAESPNN